MWGYYELVCNVAYVGKNNITYTLFYSLFCAISTLETVVCVMLLCLIRFLYIIVSFLAILLGV